MFQTTRRRLALWYTAVTAVLFLLLATGFYLYVRNTLIERIDDTLSHVVEVVQRSLVIEPVNLHSEGGPLRVNVEASFRGSNVETEDDHIDIEWFAPTGELLWSSLSEPLRLPLHLNSNGETVRVERADPTAAPNPLILRQVTQRIELGRSLLGYLRVSHPWFEVTKPTSRLVVDLTLGTIGMVSTVAAIGWLLSGLAMQPVHESYQRLKQFTADASHELRSPIAMIQTNVQVALADPDPQAQEQQLKVIERLTRRLGRLVDDLLFLARQDSGIVQPRWVTVPLDELLRDLLEEYATLAQEKKIQLELALLEPTVADSPSRALSYGPGPGSEAAIAPAKRDFWILCGDRDQLTRLFTNVVGNAVQYTPAGGQVTVQLQRLKRASAAGLQVTIRDSGIGIPTDALPHLFDRFYRVDPARTPRSGAGSGLGLAIARTIVETHQGQIQIDSTLGQGTTVTVTLPQRQPDRSDLD